MGSELTVIGLSSAGRTTGFGSGTARYVATNGNDSNGGTIGSPWRTIQTSLGKLKPGDTLYIRRGVYYESLNPFPSGTSTARIYVSGYPGETAVLDGQTTKSHAVDVERPYVTVRNLEIRNYAGTAMYAYGSAATSVIFENIYLHDIGLWGAYTSGLEISDGATGTIVRNSRFDHIGTHPYQHHGIYFANGTSGHQVYNNWITRASGGCVHAWHSDNGRVNNVDVYNNLLSCNSWGVVLGDYTHDVRVYNNTIYNCSRGIELFDYGEGGSAPVYNITLQNNLIYHSARIRIQAGVNLATITRDHNLDDPNGDPVFLNLSGNDFHLQSGSPAINAGTPISLVSTDIEGTARPQGSAYDVGAYERVVTSTPPDAGTRDAGQPQPDAGTALPKADCANVIGLCSVGSTQGFGSGTVYTVSSGQSVCGAAKRLVPGDTLYVRGGTYNETLTDGCFGTSGSAAHRIYVSGYPGETAVFDSSNAKSNAIALGSRQYLTLRNLEVRNYARVAIQLWDTANNNEFANIFMHDIGKGGNNDYSTGFEIVAVSGTVVRNSRLDNIGTDPLQHHGIYFADNASAAKIYNNWITRCSSSCVQAWHQRSGQNESGYPVHDVDVYNNLLSCTTWGIILGDAAYNFGIYNNTFYNAWQGIELFDYGEAPNNNAGDAPVHNITIKNNIFHNASTESRNGNGIYIQPADYSITADHNFHDANGNPLFVNLAGGDLHLQATSPAVNAGIAVPQVVTDIAGVPRPQGGGYDIGAYER